MTIMSYKIITYENFVKVLNETIHSLNVETLCEFYDYTYRINMKTILQI